MTSRAASFKLGAMGDSLTDEYWDSGVSTFATNWPDLLVRYRGVDMGPTAAQAWVGTWGSPRNKGYEYNWALAGATTASLLILIRFQDEPNGGRVGAWQDHAGLIHSSLSGRK
jgi:hypothetical protein